MDLFSRRNLLIGFGSGVAGLVAARLALPRVLRPGPVRSVGELSDAARRLVAQAFEGLRPERLWDVHAHVVGLDGTTGCWVNPDLRSHAHPIERLRFDLYLSASGVADLGGADERYVRRLLELHRAANPAGKLLALAFDLAVSEAGEELRERSTFHTPDEYVLALAAAHEDVEACASVHPYRVDALRRLEQAAQAGALAIKWLPNAMGIDPASPRCDAFYRRAQELGLVLLSHTGHEKAVHAEEDQVLGNPLRLRRALDAGVQVVAAHCASLGTDADLDASDPGAQEERASFDLFLRLLEEEGSGGRLFGDISALTLVNRSERPLRELLSAQELHPFLLNGSDYPVPAIDPLISMWLLARRGFLAEEERPALREIFEANALLFDLVLKRRLRVLAASGLEQRFSAQVFETQRIFAAS